VVLSLTLLAGENTTIGGLLLKILKKENGLKLLFPALSIVLANAIGLGATNEVRHCCSFPNEISLGLIWIILYYFSLQN
jgi:hypothetical protein